MARGRKRKSDAQKAAEAQSRAADALVRLPQDKDARVALFSELDELKDAARDAANGVGEQKKRMAKVFGLDPVAIQIIQKLRSLPTGRREATIRQVRLAIDDFEMDAQLDLFLDDAAPGGVEPDNGSVFDATASGERHDAERGDDPGRARKRQTKVPAPVEGTPGIPLDEAERLFTEANKAAFEHRSVN